MTKRPNALFSFHRGMLPGHLRAAGDVGRRKRIAWNRLSRAKRRKVALAAGISERIADVWAKIRWDDIPEGWKDALLSNLGAARNPMAKKKKSVKKRTTKPRRKPIKRAVKTPWKRKTRKKQNARRRRRVTRSNPRRRELKLNLTLNKQQKSRLASFVRRVTGRRVKVL